MQDSQINPLLHIYSASAGSGKTFTLTRQFLKFALQNPLQKPFRILAITFTNKATSEMRTRILSALIELAKNKESDHLQFLMDKLQLSELEVRSRAQIALTEILHGYNRFGISTIDKFFQKVLRAFAREIKRIGFETEILQDDAINFMVQGLLDDVTNNIPLRNWLLDYAKQRLDEGKAWNFKRDLSNHSSTLFSERFKELIENDSRDFDLEHYAQLKTDLQALINQLEDYHLNLFLEAKKLFIQHDENSFPQKSRNPIFALLVKPTKAPAFKLSTYSEMLTKWQNYIENNGQKLTGAQQSEGELFKSEFLDKMYDFAVEYAETYNTALLVLKNLYTSAITTDLLKHLENYRSDNNILLLSDSTQFLREMIIDSDTPFIYEKIGERYDHYLLDEFQDTSSMQWQNLKPLLRNSMDQGFENLIVGDAKQAIYRFRNGDKSLIQYKVQEEFNHQAQTLFLDTNYRSEKNVILFNNSISLLTAQLLKEYTLQDANDETLTFMNEELDKTIHLYKNSAQNFTDKSNGYVEFDWILEEENNEDKSADINLKTYDIIIDAHQRGYRLSDICVLSRKNKHLQSFAEFITHKNLENTNFKIETVSSETGLLTKSAAIRTIISFMKFIHNPKDSLFLAESLSAWFELKKIPFPADLLRNHKTHEVLLALLPSDFDYRALAQKSLLDIYHSIIHGLQLQLYKEHAPYLQGLEDRIIQFIQKYRTGLHDFLNIWNEKAHTYMLTVANDSDGVKLMTVHKSKGLEFPIVIFLGNDITFKPMAIEKMWAKSENSVANKISVLNVNVAKELLETAYKWEYQKECIESINDGLNVFYVGITRAEKELYFLSNYSLTKKGEVSKLDSISKLLIHYLLQNEANLRESSNIFLNPNSLFENPKMILGTKENYIPKIKKTATQMVNADFYSCNPNRNIKIKPARVLTEKKEVRLGMLTHEILAMIKSQKDINQVIQEWFMLGEINEDERNELEKLLGQLFGNIVIASWFNTDAEILTETPLISTNGAIRIPDRILIHKDFNEIIDFKTGHEREEYHTQIKEYAQLISNLTGNPSKSYILYLHNQTIKEI